ncbi:MAG: hypothetical protein ABJA18_12745 [bacterium]
MAETEVESILREIRERVLSQQRAGKDAGATRSAITNGGNGDNVRGESDSLQQIRSDDNETMTAESLSLINSYLTTTARAWDRLPPLVSNRSGLVARVELWLKRQLKRATHWYTWEQVNFNAAVHHALRDLLPVILELRRQIAESEIRRTELEQYQAELTAKLSELQTEIDSQRRATDTQRNLLENELRERDQRLQEEQRVCFKQLALETSEAAVLEDRARRKTEVLLEELQRRLEQLEK